MDQQRARFDRRAHRFDMRALLGQCGRGPRHRCLCVARQRQQRIGIPHRHARTFHVASRGLGALVQHAPQQLGVVDIARHRPADAQIGLGVDTRRRWHVSAHRQHAPSRLERDDTAKIRRRSQRAADVRSDLERRHTASQRRRRAPGRSTRHACGVIGIVGRAVDRVVALPIAQHQRHIGLTPWDGAAGAGARDQFRVGAILQPVREGRKARRRRQARHVIAVLDRHRQAGERAERRILCARFVDGGGIGLRPHDVGRDDRVDCFGDPIVARQMRIQQIARRNLLCLQLRQHRTCRSVSVDHGVPRLCLAPWHKLRLPRTPSWRSSCAPPCSRICPSR